MGGQVVHLFYATFSVTYGLRCNVLSMETNGFDHAMRGGKYILRSIVYSLPTFTHTHADIRVYTSWSTGLCSKPLTVHTSSTV